MSERWKAIKRDSKRFGAGMIELDGFPGVTHVLTEEEAVDLGSLLLRIMGEPTIGEIKGRYPALVELVQNWKGGLGQRARIELLTLWGVFDPTTPDESAELARLRGIEQALDVAADNLAPGAPWRVLADDLDKWGISRWGDIMRAIADALEADNGE